MSLEPETGAPRAAPQAAPLTAPHAGLEALDPVLTSPKRLAAMAVLSRAQDADFAFLRQHLQVSDSDLSKQMSALQAAGYVDVRKAGRGRGGATTYKITPQGRATYERHRAVLRAIVG